MPHITIEYSENLTDHADVAQLVAVVHAAALSTGVPELAALRTRAMSRTEYRIADGDPDNMFVAVIARIREGRSDAIKQTFMDALMSAVCDELADVYEHHPLAISLELQEIDGRWSARQNNLHERLASS